MNVYYYDKSFEGLLSVVFDAYTRKVFPDALLASEEALLLANAHQVQSSSDKAGRVFTALRKKLSQEGIYRLLAAWLAEEPDGDLAIFRFIRRVLDSRQLLESDCGDAAIFAIQQMARRVNRERHRLMGFVRFQQSAQGVYFAAIAPRHNVLPLLLNHFTRRFADQSWIIYDTGRRYGMYYDLCSVQEAWLADEKETPTAILQNGGLRENLLAEGEALLQSLWQGYFKAAAVKERSNPKLQRQFMPRRYWQYLTELQI